MTPTQLLGLHRTILVTGAVIAHGWWGAWVLLAIAAGTFLVPTQKRKRK
jgi:hypothetical protein